MKCVRYRAGVIYLRSNVRTCAELTRMWMLWPLTVVNHPQNNFAADARIRRKNSDFFLFRKTKSTQVLHGARMKTCCVWNLMNWLRGNSADSASVVDNNVTLSQWNGRIDTWYPLKWFESMHSMSRLWLRLSQHSQFPNRSLCHMRNMLRMYRLQPHVGKPKIAIDEM